ncbi:outer membrane protein Iml2/Tetratricopeptide repeat protein 39 [Phellopilus nigrolimitatus]|nr:outer membrane protein Iml2/Tetratricopeptide repeat protein 39 [Phellopilus nigrolimitatus]
MTGNMEKTTVDAQTAALVSASEGFDHLFANRIEEARVQFAAEDSPFHVLGLGVCAFLEAALGMEPALMGEAARCLGESEAGARRQSKATRVAHGGKSNFPSGIEFEILQADAIVLQGLVHALGESYMGYLQCLYALNNAHSKFTKLYKTVFPAGLDYYITPATTPLPSRNPSTPSLTSSRSAGTISAATSSSKGSFFGRWGFSVSAPSMPQEKPAMTQPEGPVEELIVSGAAFGFGLFNLVFSLLPAKIKTVVGFLGFQSDRRLALQALAVSAARKDVHSVFAGLTLMTYHGIVLLLAGYQADEAHIVKQYKAIVESVSARYPDGALWILNRAKILRMTYDPEGAIAILQDGLRPERVGHFQQADALLVFELAWTLLSQRRYQEAADMFLRMTEINSWSHATYYAIAGGCYVSLGNRTKAKELFDEVPTLLDRRKIGGKDLPTEVLIKKKLAFYKAKAKRRSGDESDYVEHMKISLAEELAIFWNTHQRITQEVALEHVKELASFSPAVAIPSPHITQSATPAESKATEDLDTPDELAVRSLILGIVHRTLGDFNPSRNFLADAHNRYDAVECKWVGGVALFELAVLDLKEVEAREKNEDKANDPKPSNGEWSDILRAAGEKLDRAMAISGNSVDLSSRLDGRVNMLRDEIATKREKLGL